MTDMPVAPEASELMKAEMMARLIGTENLVNLADLGRSPFKCLPRVPGAGAGSSAVDTLTHDVLLEGAVDGSTEAGEAGSAGGEATMGNGVV